MNTYLTVSVQFNAGVVKTFLAPREILLEDFVQAVRAYGGKFRTMRFQADSDQSTADLLVGSGNAIMVEARRVEA